MYFTREDPDLPSSNQIAALPSGSHAADGMIGSVNTKSKKKSSKNSSPIITLPDSPTGESSPPELSTDIHAIETVSYTHLTLPTICSV